jgi:hypothetical protein
MAFEVALPACSRDDAFGFNAIEPAHPTNSVDRRRRTTGT